MILGGDIWVYAADFFRYITYLLNFRQNGTDTHKWMGNCQLRVV